LQFASCRFGQDGGVPRRVKPVCVRAFDAAPVARNLLPESRRFLTWAAARRLF
jgi:hypothetical protein